MRIAVGSDHRGYGIRSKVIELCERLGHEVEDIGTWSPEAVDYPDVASMLACKVGRGEVDQGILVCGTGLGMCIAANKLRGVRAAPCHDDLTAELSRRHNDANVLAIGQRMVTLEAALEIVDLWLATPFDGGRHARRIRKIDS